MRYASWVGCFGVVLATGTAAPALAQVAGGEAVLVRDATALATIVLGAAPTKAAQLAAFEVQHHVQLITGARLAVVKEGETTSGVPIYVGATEAARSAGIDAAAFKPQEYVVRVSTGAVFLLGCDAPATDTVAYDPVKLAFQNLPGFWEEQGTVHAAYDFLEQGCGVRWFNPTEAGTVCRQTPTLSVRAMERRRVPGSHFRDAIGAMGDNPARYDDYTQLWPAGSPELKKWEELAYASVRERGLDLNACRGVLAHLFLLRQRNGGQMQRCNHSLYGYYERFWRKPETRRPEMFAKGYEGEPPQMCYTSRELIQQLAQDARDYYDGKKTGAELAIFWQPRLPNWFPLEPMDNGSYCKCDACRAWLRQDAGGGFSTGIHSDYFFNFVNEVTRELRKTHPDRGIVTLAYASHAALPEKLKLDPGVAVQFCYTSNRVGQDPHEIELLNAWAAEARTSGRPLYLWLYDTFPVETARNANLNCWPGFFAHEIGSQMRLFHDLGYRGMFHCGYGQEIEAYVTFKFMDDPSRDVEVLLDEYFTGLYGSAAEPMRKLYAAIEKPHLSKAPTYTREQMDELGTLLRQAQTQASEAREKRNVELFDLAVWSYMLAGFEQRERIKATAIPVTAVPRLAPAGGDMAKVAWDSAAPLPGPWYRNNSDRPAAHKLSGRIAHDGQYLYLELTDACETAKLTSSAMVFPFDDWEVFVATQRVLPYRQFALNPGGLKVALSHGEVNFRTNVVIEDPPFQVVSDATAADRWVSRLAWPLAEILPGGIKPGGKFYLNVIRVWALPGQTADGSGIDAWGPFTKVHDVTRLPELTLE